MGVNASAAEAAARSPPDGPAGIRAGPSRGAFNGRQVTEQAGGALASSMAEGREARSTARAGREAVRKAVAPSQGPFGAFSNRKRTDSQRSTTESAERETASRSPGLSWLSPHQQAERRTFHRRLDAFQDRGDIAMGLVDGLSSAVVLVSQVEQDILRADELLKASQTSLLGDADWRELTLLVWQNKYNMSLYRSQLYGKLAGLEERAAPDAASCLADELRQRFEDADDFLYTDDLPWDDIARRVETALPSSPDTKVVVESRIVFGTALGSRVMAGYPLPDRTCRSSDAANRHVPDLAQTVLVDARGKTLFAGLRHGLLHCDFTEIDGKLLACLSDEALKAVVEDRHLTRRRRKVPSGETRAERIDRECRKIRSSRQYADMTGASMTLALRRELASETAAAALVSVTEKFQQALSGETVDLKLFAISLLAPGEFLNWGCHANALDELVELSPIVLALRGPDRLPRVAQVNVEVRQFVFSPDEDSFEFTVGEYLRGRDRMPDVERLLGSGASGNLGGDVKAEADAINGRVSELQGDLLALHRKYDEMSSERTADHPDVLAVRDSIARMQSDKETLERNGRCLVEAGQRLTTLRAYARGWCAGAESHRKAAALLALVAHLMGEIPVLNCMTGRDLVERLDPEIKFLVTVAANQDGHLPPAEPDIERWGPARNAFTPQ